MRSMDGWDLALWALAGYLAIVALVRLMARHRDSLTARFRQEMEEQRLRQKKLDQQHKTKTPGGPAGRDHAA
jgi:hypothetical protein